MVRMRARTADDSSSRTAARRVAASGGVAEVRRTRGRTVSAQDQTQNEFRREASPLLNEEVSGAAPRVSMGAFDARGKLIEEMREERRVEGCTPDLEGGQLLRRLAGAEDQPGAGGSSAPRGGGHSTIRLASSRRGILVGRCC